MAQDERAERRRTTVAPFAGVVLLLLAGVGCTVKTDLSLDLAGAEDAATLPSDVASGTDGAGVPDRVAPDLVVPDVPLPPPDGIVVPPDVPVPSDAVDVSPTDLSRPELPTPRYCPWDLTTLPLVTRSTVFRGESFFDAPNSSSPLDRACDGGLFPDRTKPERVFLVQVEEDTELFVRTRCYGWDCDAVLVREDCLSSNVALCLTTDGDERYGVAVGPGLYYVILEARLDFEAAPFDLHLALNRPRGPDPCPVAGEFRLSALDAFADCVVRDGQGWREWMITGDTASPDARDDVFARCVGPTFHTDTVGGAPDFLWRIVADTAEARTLEATLTPAVPATAEPTWDAVLAVTSAPCGDDAALVDCDYAPFATTEVGDVTLLRGDEVYVVVEGMGERALDGQAAGPFTLTLRVSDPDCASE